MTLTVASWNVNSIKARLPNVLDWLKEAAPDVVCLQEVWARHDESSGAVEDQMVRLADDLGGSQGVRHYRLTADRNGTRAEEVTS